MLNLTGGLLNLNNKMKKTLTFLTINLFLLVLTTVTNPVYAEESKVRTFTSTVTANNAEVYNAQSIPSITIDSKASIFQKFFQMFDKDKNHTVTVRNPNDMIIEEKQINFTATESINLEENDLLPGKYSVFVDGKKMTDFYWGVLAINTNKSIYQPNDIAGLSIAVLDDHGEMVCDAKLSLEITNPDGNITKLLSEKGEIRTNPECFTKTLTRRPDYEAVYTVSGDGVYQMKLTSVVNGVTTVSNDTFMVDSSIMFDVERITATRIFPQNIQPVQITVTARDDFKGTFVEKVSTDFVISDTSGKAENGEIKWDVNLSAGQSTELTYSYDAPDVSPEFYLLGPAEIIKDEEVVFTEYRTWQIAVDALTQVTATADTTTTSATDVQMNAMTITPGAGDYMVFFSTSIKKSTGSSVQNVSLYVNGAQVTHTDRTHGSDGSYDTGDIYTVPVMISAYVAGVGAGQVIEIKWKTSAGTATALERTLAVQSVTASDISQATATANDTTASTTDVQLNSMTLTPGAGDYIVYFSSSMENTATSETVISIYVNGSQVTHTQRSLYTEASFTNTSYPVSTQAFIAGVGAGQVVEVKWKVTAGTATARQRALVVQKVDPANAYQASVTADSTSTSTTDVTLESMSITPGVGDYHIFFSTSVNNSNVGGGSTQNFSIYINDAQVAHSERQSYTEDSHDTGLDSSFPSTTHAYVTGVRSDDIIQIKWRTTAGTITSRVARTLTILKVSATPSTTATESYYKFDEGYAQILHNSITTSNAASLGINSGSASDDPTWATEDLCVSGKCLNFTSASSQFVNIIEGLTTVKSVGFWVKPTSTTTSFTVLNGFTGNATVTATSGTISAGAGFTSPTIYVNGNVSSTIVADAWQYVLVTTSTGISASNIAIGRVNTSYLNGYIDDFKMYSTVLTAAEIKADYTSGTAKMGTNNGTSVSFGKPSGYLSAGPVAYWKMDENTGTTAYDSSGNHLHGTFTNGPTWNAGKFGSGVKFDGTNDEIRSTSSSFEITSAITVQAWVKVANFNGVNDVQILNKTNGSNGYGLEIGFSSHVPKFRVGNGTSYNTISASTVILTDKWYFITGTQAADGTQKIYVNGILENTATITGSLTAAVGQNFSLGTRGGGDLLNGNLDEFKIYNYVRTQSQVMEDFNNGKIPPILELKFDEGYGDTAYDTGTLQSNGDLASSNTCPGNNQCPLWTDDSKFGKALNFIGNDDIVYLNGTNSDRLDNTGDITISTWIKPRNFNDGDYIVHKGETGSELEADNDNYFLRWDITSGNDIEYGHEYGAGSDEYHIFDTNLNTNTWYKIVLVRDTIAKTVKLYLNGKLINQITYTNNPTGGTGGEFAIGSDDDNSADYIEAIIDDFKIYNVALTQNQLLLDSNQKSTVVLGSVSDTSFLSGGSIASSSASAAYCVPGAADTCTPPVAVWKFDENTGVTSSKINDTSGNSNNLTINNYVEGFWQPCAKGSCMKTKNSDGTITHASVSDPAGELLDFSDTQDYTLSMWTKWIAAENTVQVLYYKGGNSDTETGYSMQVNSTFNYKCYYADANVGARESATSTTLANDNKWHYVSCVMDRNGTATGTVGLHIFVDGKLEGSDTSLTELTGVNTRTIQIGETDTSWEFEAYIDDVKVYNYARKPAQIAWDYNQGKPFVYYEFDECTGNTANDSSGNGYSRTVTIGGSGTNTTAGTCTTSGAWFNGATGKLNSSLNFDGTDDYVDLGTFNSLNGSRSFTITFWIYKEEDGNFPTFDGVFGLGSSGQRTPWIYGVSGAQNLTVNFETTTGGVNDCAVGSGTIAANAWSFIAVRWTGSQCQFFVNNRPIGTADTTTGGILANTDGTNYIGRIGNFDYWNGNIDDFRIYNYALTPQQIKMVSNKGSAVRFGP